MSEWSLHDAKNRFSAVVNAALSGEPQTVTRRGAPAVVVLAVEEFQRLCQAEKAGAPTFIDHLLAIPEGGPDDLVDQAPVKLRDVEGWCACSTPRECLSVQDGGEGPRLGRGSVRFQTTEHNEAKFSVLEDP